jgi:hypothetical protein
MQDVVDERETKIPPFIHSPPSKYKWENSKFNVSAPSLDLKDKTKNQLGDHIKVQILLFQKFNLTCELVT